MAREESVTLQSAASASRPGEAIERSIKAQQDLKILYQSLRLEHQRPPQIEFTLEDDADTDIACRSRQIFVHKICSENQSRRPNLWRYANCYAYYLNKANVNILRKAPRNSGAYRDAIQALHQIQLFDHTQYHTNHPCDAPASSIGQDYLTGVVMLLKYTIYTRYRDYVGRDLESFDFLIKPAFKTLWHEAYNSIADEHEFLTISDACTGKEMCPVSPYPHMVAIAHRLNHLLGLPPMTVESAIESFEEYAQYRHDDEAWKESRSEEETYELEDLIQHGEYTRFARVLHRDYLTLNALLRFETADKDIFHLQAVISGLATSFFGARCTSEQTVEEVNNWRPNHILRLQVTFFESGDRRFSAQVQWKLRAEAEKAERKFGKAWRALCYDNGENRKEVQELLAVYLKTLGVEDATLGCKVDNSQ